MKTVLNMTDVLLGKVADALLRVRLNQNLTQQTVADRSGISLKAVVNLESARLGASSKRSGRRWR